MGLPNRAVQLLVNLLRFLCQLHTHRNSEIEVASLEPLLRSIERLGRSIPHRT